MSVGSIYKIPHHLEIAISQIGVYEFNNGSNPTINEYLKVVGMPSNDAIPWCSAFVNWCLFKAKVMPTFKPNARSFLLWGLDVDKPEVGDIVVLRRGYSTWKGHVGFYLDDYMSFIRILGGNQKNRVGVNAYSKIRLLGYRRPI